jgi:hypothetical protein
MKKDSRWCILLFFIATLFFFSTTAKATPISWGILKAKGYTQIDENNYAGDVEYGFGAEFEGTDVTSVTLDVPTSPSTQYTLIEDEPDYFEYTQVFTSETALNTTFPNGTYTFNVTYGINDPTYDVVMSGSFPTQIPKFVDGVEGVLPGEIIDILTPTFYWEPWGSPPSSGLIYFGIWDAVTDETIVDMTLDSSYTSYTVLPGLLQWGRNYGVGLGFTDIVYYYEGEGGSPVGLGLYATGTEMEFSTVIPEPASMILLGSLATGLFGAAAVRKRKRS